jgi:phosphoglycerate dehydrogenase-like enzyme
MPEDIVHVLITTKFSKEHITRFEAISPRLKFYVHPARHLSEVPNKLWKIVEVLYTTHILPPAGSETQLKWVQSHFAGVDALTNHPFMAENPDIVITSTRGIHATNIGEYVLGAMIMLGHHFPAIIRDQQHEEWREDRHERYLPKEIRNSTVGILGYGSIGREVARLAKMLGATVLATKRNLKRLEHDAFHVEGTGDPEGEIFDRLYPPEATRSLLKECDFVVVTLPLTDSTRNLLDSTMFEVMKPTAYLINVSRGGIVNEDALFIALQEAQIAGALMDVFAIEPLPPHHPLWSAHNLIVSPHIAGSTSDYNDKAAAVFEENLRRYLEDKPLKNVVDRKLGY